MTRRKFTHEAALSARALEMTVGISEVPILLVYENERPLSSHLQAVNFLRCGCPMVQLVYLYNPAAVRPPRNIEQDLEDFGILLEKLARGKEKFTIENHGLFGNDRHTNHYLVDITRNIK